MQRCLVALNTHNCRKHQSFVLFLGQGERLGSLSAFWPRWPRELKNSEHRNVFRGKSRAIIVSTTSKPQRITLLTMLSCKIHSAKMSRRDYWEMQQKERNARWGKCHKLLSPNQRSVPTWRWTSQSNLAKTANVSQTLTQCTEKRSNDVSDEANIEIHERVHRILLTAYLMITK